MDSLIRNRHELNHLDAKILNSYEKSSVWRNCSTTDSIWLLVLDNEVSKLRSRIESILASIYSLDSSTPSLPLSQAQGTPPNTTTVDIFVDHSNTTISQLQSMLSSLSQDLLSLELHFLSLSDPSDPVPWSGSSLSDRIDALHSAMSSLYEKTDAISAQMQVTKYCAMKPSAWHRYSKQSFQNRTHPSKEWTSQCWTFAECMSVWRRLSLCSN